MGGEEGPRQSLSAWLELEPTKEMEKVLQSGGWRTRVSESLQEVVVSGETDAERPGRLKTTECLLDLGKWSHR